MQCVSVTDEMLLAFRYINVLFLFEYMYNVLMIFSQIFLVVCEPNGVCESKISKVRPVCTCVKLRGSDWFYLS